MTPATAAKLIVIHRVQSAASTHTLCGDPIKYVIRTGNNPPVASPISQRYLLLPSPLVIALSSSGEYARKQEIRPSKRRTRGTIGIKYVQKRRDQRNGHRKGTNNQAAIGMNSTDSNVNG